MQAISTYQLNSKFSDQDQRKNPKPFFGGKKLLVVIIGLIICLIGFQLFLSNYLSTKGKEVFELESKAQVMEEENLALKVEIAKLSSLSQLSASAQPLGLKKTTAFIYLENQTPLALKE